jgi:hypothetical protein
MDVLTAVGIYASSWVPFGAAFWWFRRSLLKQTREEREANGAACQAQVTVTLDDHKQTIEKLLKAEVQQAKRQLTLQDRRHCSGKKCNGRLVAYWEEQEDGSILCKHCIAELKKG